MGKGSLGMGLARTLFTSASRRQYSHICKIPLFYSVVTLAAIFCLLPAKGSLAQNLDQPPQQPVETGVTPPPAAQEPPELKSQSSPQGETPYDTSKPPTDYTEGPEPTVSVTGGVNVPVNDTNLRLDASFWRVEFEEGCAAVVIARGNVHALYREFKVTSETATADLRTKVATFSGNVVLTIQGQDVRGQSLTINMDTRAWSFQSASSELRPELFPDIIKAPVFLTGKTITGIADQEVSVTGGGFTTCNLEHPHYFMDAKQVTVWPNRKLVAKDAAFYAIGRLVFKIARFAVPLRQVRDRQILMPRVGQTQEEGFFLKAAYTVLASAANTGTLKLDLMTKKGVGVGYEDNYTVRAGSGNLWLYQLSDQNRHLNTLTGRFTHEQTLGTIKANLSSDYRANSYQYSPGSSSLSNDLRLSRYRDTANTNMEIRYTQDHGFGTFANLASSLQHNQVLSANSSANVSFDYFRATNPIFVNGNSINAANSQLASRFDYQRRESLFDWNFRVNKINDLSDEAFIQQSGTRFAGTEKIPELELTSSTDRLKTRFPFGLPANLGLAVGEYNEDLGRVQTSRAAFDVEVPPKSYTLAEKLKLNASAGFRQYFYGDNTAQYAIQTALALNRKIGKKSSAVINYRYLRPRGFTPFRFDFIGKYNFLNARIDVLETERLKYSIYSGYNFGASSFRWQDIVGRVSYAPNDTYLLYASTGYDLNRSQWRALINQVRVRVDNNFKLDVGSRYDFQQHKFATLKAQLDTPLTEKWHIRANAGYNGFTNAFDYRNIQLVRDLHCWEMSIAFVDQQGFWQERGFQLSLRIKAFPIFDNFGVGQFGQSLDTSVGDVL